MALLTTTVGWFPKPAFLRRARRQFGEGEIDTAGLRAAEQRARGEALEMQSELGLDQLVDGQMDRSDPVSYFAEKLTGMELGGLVRCFDNRYYRRPRIVDAVERTQAITVDGWSAAQQVTDKPIKAVLTGPYTLMDWSFDEYYPSREKCAMALAAIVRAEAEALVEAGAREIEIDEPAISSRPDEMELAAAALGHVTEALRGKARSWTHICYGDLLPVLDEVFALPVDGLLLEMANSGFCLLSRLGELPADKQLGAGVVDVHRAASESVDEVRGRAERLLQQVPADRLWLMPDAGLRTLGTAMAREKLQAIVDAAASLG